MTTARISKQHVAVIGGGPGGLMAAEKIAAAGHAVTVYERKPTMGRKFMMAGHGGLNITHSENLDDFLSRYGRAASRLKMAIEEFSPTALREWCAGLGEPTFVGSSGRVFPQSFKASPLLRAWQARLTSMGVVFALRHEWRGWNKDGYLAMADAQGHETVVKADAVVLSLGGASWPRLGADGQWADFLRGRGVNVHPFRPSNCGFVVDWSDMFAEKFSGHPLKPVSVSFDDKKIDGEMMITAKGIEGGAVYALSSLIRDAVERDGQAVIHLDLRPGVALEGLAQRLSAPRAGMSFSNFLRKAGGLSPLAAGLVRELGGVLSASLSPQELAELIKKLPLKTSAPFSLDRAISSAGGIDMDEVDDFFMLRKLPGVYAVGEMLDWEAPTGGYLLQATFSTAVRAAAGVVDRFLSN